MRKQYSTSSSFSDQLMLVAGLVALIWIVFLLSRVFPLEQFGLLPRKLSGLFGIFTMPFLHGSWGHIISNTVPLLILLALLSGTRKESWSIAFMIVLVGGVLLWLFGRPAMHIGASGLIFGLIAFLILVGFFEKRFVSVIVSLVVALGYGSSLLWGVLPVAPGVSWDGHLTGAVAGGITAYLSAR